MNQDRIGVDPTMRIRNDHGAIPPYDPLDSVLSMELHDDDAGDLLMALLGWDQAVLRLAASDDERAGQVLLSLVAWLLVDQL